MAYLFFFGMFFYEYQNSQVYQTKHKLTIMLSTPMILPPDEANEQTSQIASSGTSLDPWTMTKTSQSGVSVRRFRKTVKVPRVAYQSLSNFHILFENFLKRMSEFLRKMILSWVGMSVGPNQLVWSRRDLLVNGMADFPEIVIEGKKLLFEMTMKNGMEWCDYIMSRISECIVSAYRTFVRVVIHWNPALDHPIFVTGLQNEIVTTLFENIDLFLKPLHDNNFVVVHRNNVVAREVWEDMILAFFSGMIPRLGSQSVVSLLNSDVCSVLRRHIDVTRI